MAGQDGTQKDPYDLGKDPNLTDLLLVLERRVKLHIRTNVPGTISVFNPATSTASVLVGTLAVTRLVDPNKIPKAVALVNPQRGEITLAPILLQEVPVVFPGSSNGGVTWPILPGDTGMLAISDRALDRWKLVGAPTDPVLAATHALQDAVFTPGLRSLVNALSAVDITATVVDGATFIKIGAAAVDAIAKADTLISVIDAAWAAATPIATDGGANLKATWLVSWNAAKATIKALKGKVE